MPRARAASPVVMGLAGALDMPIRYRTHVLPADLFGLVPTFVLGVRFKRVRET